MASLIDVSGLTLNPEEAREIAKAIIEEGFAQGGLSEDHEIETGVEMKTQIPFIGGMGDSLKASSGCVPNAGGGIALSEKFWEPKAFDTRWEHCAADMNGLLKLFKRAQKMNPDFYDRIGSEELGMIYSMIDRMLLEQLPKKVWFSDVAAAIQPAGAFTTGTDLDLFNVIDGLFKQIFTDGAIPKVSITENLGVTYAGQALAVDAAYGYFEEMVEKADSRLLDDMNAVIYCTRSMADNYRKTLRNKTLGAGFIEITEGGKTTLKFDGYEVKVKSEWDRTIKADQDNGTVLNLPHRFVFTTKENIPVATLSADDLTKLDSFYDQYRKSNVTDVVFTLDTKHLESYRTVAGY